MWQITDKDVEDATPLNALSKLNNLQQAMITASGAQGSQRSELCMYITSSGADSARPTGSREQPGAKDLADLEAALLFIHSWMAERWIGQRVSKDERDEFIRALPREIPEAWVSILMGLTTRQIRRIRRYETT